MRCSVNGRLPGTCLALLIGILVLPGVRTTEAGGMDRPPASESGRIEWIRGMRHAMAAYEGDGGWENLPPSERKKRLREWRSLPPNKRRELKNRMERWRQMDDRDRRLYEHRYHQWKQLDPADRRKLLRKLDRWETLSPEEREAIRRRFRNP